MGTFTKTCVNCKEQFPKKKIQSTGLCEGCSQHAHLLLSVFNHGYNNILHLIDNSSDLDEIISKYSSLCDFALNELNPWFKYDCFPQLSEENIMARENEIYQKLNDHIHFLIKNAKNKSGN